MEWRDRIVSDPEILAGKPVIKGTRISVELIIGWLANDWTFDQLLESYPHIAREELSWRLHFVMGALSYTLAGTDVLKVLSQFHPEEASNDEDDEAYPYTKQIHRAHSFFGLK